ncbi:radial spoke head 1 homolog [Tribolium madens]|uniref:radial spoke head 1 homolog n=1 Tax=Tribolium madens TaxID=41895 RepID=UPI001CF755A9|nr:radial spoke head 1 homolog [Tribolium madens]
MNKGFQEGEREFIFPNRDKYSGQFCAHVSGIAWRQGRGIYETHDNQHYEGNWKDDKLNEDENLQIIFKNNDSYDGKIKKYKYNGPGTYTFHRGGRLCCDFLNNKPSGNVIFIDYKGHLWFGDAGVEHTLLYQEHIFSQELDPERGKGRPLIKETTIKNEEEEEEEITEEEKPDLKELERQVFAKSTKTKSDIDFEDSDWFKNYQKSTELRKIVLEKLSTLGVSSLTDEEKTWFKEYYTSAKILEERKKPKKINHDLLKQHFDEESKNTCPPSCIFYASNFSGEN